MNQPSPTPNPHSYRPRRGVRGGGRTANFGRDELSWRLSEPPGGVAKDLRLEREEGAAQPHTRRLHGRCGEDWRCGAHGATEDRGPHGLACESEPCLFPQGNPPTQIPTPRSQRCSVTSTAQPRVRPRRPFRLSPGSSPCSPTPQDSQPPGLPQLEILPSQSCSIEGSRALRSSRHFPQDPGF